MMRVRFVFRGLALLVCTLLAQAAGAQQFNWVQTRPFSPSGQFPVTRALAADAQGGVALARPAGPISFWSGPGLSAVEVLHYAAGGPAPAFARLLRGTGEALALHYDARGDLLLLGRYADSLQFPAGPVLRNPKVAPFLAKFSPDGQLQWAHDLTTVLGAGISEAQSLATDPAGNIFLGYTRHTPAAMPHTEVARLSPQLRGSPQVLLRQERVTAIRSLHRDAAGNLLVAGACVELGATFGGQAVTVPNFSYVAYLARYSAAGQLRWVRLLEDGTCPHAQVAADGQGGYYYGVDLMMTSPIQLGPFRVQALSADDYLLARLDSSGSWQWVRQLPASSGSLRLGDTGREQFLGADALGNVYLAGTCDGTIDWGGSVGTTAGFYDAAVVSYDRAGNLRWVRLAGGPDADGANSLAVTPAGEVYLAGFAQNTAAFGTLPAGAPGTAYSFLAQLGGSLLPNREAHSSAWQLYPNPAAAAGSVHIRLPQAPSAPVGYQLRDALGRVVRTGSWQGTSFELPTRGLRPGAYLLTVQLPQELPRTQRLLLQ
ncbi:hypothetical protein [Hymenobacter sp. B81]|uniref:hypothetical protein n=1 Tax=Hymenobacter sp. B81 TaxID=3344878 RepID=UPI0037DCE4B2